MLIRFAIQSAALAASYGDAAATLAAHRRLIGLWKTHGVLVHSGQTIQQSEFKNLDALPQTQRILWQQAIQRLDTRGVRAPWQPLPDELKRDHLEGLSNHASACALSPTAITALGMDAEAPIQHSEGVDFARFDMLDESQSFKRMQHRAVSTIRHGDPRDAVWRDYFADLVELGSGPLVVVDRYAAMGSANRSGLSYLVSKVGSAGRMTVFSGCPDDVDAVALSQQVLEETRESSRQSGCVVNLILAPDRQFGALAHDRYIRVGERVLAIDTGLALFANQTVGIDTRLAFGPRATEAAREARLRQAATIGR